MNSGRKTQRTFEMHILEALHETELLPMLYTARDPTSERPTLELLFVLRDRALVGRSDGRQPRGPPLEVTLHKTPVAVPFCHVCEDILSLKAYLPLCKGRLQGCLSLALGVLEGQVVEGLSIADEILSVLPETPAGTSGRLTVMCERWVRTVRRPSLRSDVRRKFEDETE